MIYRKDRGRGAFLKNQSLTREEEQATADTQDEKNAVYKISDFLENFNKQTVRGSCKVCSANVSWRWERLKSHKRSNCTSEEDRRRFAIRKTDKLNLNGSTIRKPTQPIPSEISDASDFPKEIVNHKNYCRLCLQDERNKPKFQINSMVQQSIFALHIEVCLHLIQK